ncbi:DNA helicase/exodeoxyribonuclease V beta subunit [Paraperlucidibaca baekdonensis]|uniref:RecBCD enzyme subunit RecB n=1 Tax=Paraperlucidibaca baekdonensis TaxID=748120 RepID=A0A3E0H4L2_9GAMM|nr:exodeoxyribonuclease V subunit beta [Paraperlucidibaca baekdonensis]REH37764.1 DNA helicase/exodeoxyribonuclease V beta subunit [Paraperlucidibaca baekdonensis]
MSASLRQELNVLGLPLDGIQLIEASAGTGKTFTIALLYVRLVLGHDARVAACRGRSFSPAELVVLTFTDAAAGELRDRIRARLSEAALAFSISHSDDPYLQALIDDYAHDDHAIAAQRLRDAEQRLDEAEIGTIHSWCLRVLQQHAFASGSLFQQRLRSDVDSLRLQVVRDVWRQWFYGQSPALLGVIHRIWPSPDALDKSLKPLLDAPQAALCHGDKQPGGQYWQAILATYERQLTKRSQDAKALWQAWLADGQTVTDLLLAEKRFNARSIDVDVLAALPELMRAWQGEGELDAKHSRPMLKTLAKYFAPADDGRSFLAHKVKVAHVMPEHPLIDQTTAFIKAAIGEVQFKIDLLTALRQEVGHQLDMQLREAAELTFDDVLTRLYEALHGESGEAFAALLRQRFPVALIDEFQDTDPIQFGIFQRLYQHADAQALILIGDPKQAIYSFRGADLPTYFAARALASRPIHTLLTNFRTDASVIAGINHFYREAMQREGGAFAQTGSDELIYDDAKAHQVNSRLHEFKEGKWSPVLGVQIEWQSQAELMSSGIARKQLAEQTAQRIAGWLNASDHGELMISEHAQRRALGPGDIAVLVRKGIEAKAMREALSRVGVPCVYGSDRDSVFASSEAEAVQYWLEAMASPSDERRLRLSLATAPLGLSWQTLQACRDDEAMWERELERVHRLALVWRRHGVLAALRQWLFAHDVPARLLHPDRVDGERALTNILHIAELLQQAATHLHGEQALIRYLAEQRSGQGTRAGEEALVRLESDERRVRIVTVHQSKGLEYPVVCLPFSAMPSLPPKFASTRYHRDGQLIVDLGPDDAAKALAKREQLEEELRLFYVAVTRAKYLLWMAVAPVAQGNSQTRVGDHTAWQWLFAGHQALTPEALSAGMEALLGARELCSLVPAPASQWQPQACDDALLPAREFAPLHQPFWQIASYSRLRFQAATQSPSEANFLDEPAAEIASVVDVTTPAGASIAAPSIPAPSALPRGAAVGTFWHSLLELAAEQQFASSADNLAVLDAALERQCQAHGWQAAMPVWQQDIRRWLSRSLNTEYSTLNARSQAAAVALAGTGLADLQQFMVEMEFWFSSDAVSTRSLDAVVNAHTLAQRRRPEAESQHLDGLFKGFIDLVFVHEGRYYVADYKSNYLGEEIDNYHPECLAADIAKHRYDMQYSLYLLALHRHLRARLADYDPERHLGGAVYIYLRGWNGEGHGVHIERPETALVDALDALFIGTGAMP